MYVFGESETARIANAVRRVERLPLDERWVRRKSPIDSGSDGGGCDPQNTIWQITGLGKFTGGTWQLQVTINGVSTSLSFSWNSTTSAFSTTLATHSEIGSTANLIVTGGGFPNSTMQVEFIGALADMDIHLPYATWGSLTGGTGVGIICSLAQKGHN